MFSCFSRLEKPPRARLLLLHFYIPHTTMLNEKFPTLNLYSYTESINILSQFSHEVRVRRPKILMQILVQYIDKYELCISKQAYRKFTLYTCIYTEIVFFILIELNIKNLMLIICNCDANYMEILCVKYSYRKI